MGGGPRVVVSNACLMGIILVLVFVIFLSFGRL